LERDAVDATARETSALIGLREKPRRDGTKAAERLLRKAFADGEVVWS
jgi:hypothetical protein